MGRRCCEGQDAAEARMPRQVRRAALARLCLFFSPTPRRSRRQNHPNLFLLGFRLKLMTIVYFQKKPFRHRWPLSAKKRLEAGWWWGGSGQGQGTRKPRRDRGPVLDVLRYWAYRGCYRPPSCWGRASRGSGTALQL